MNLLLILLMVVSLLTISEGILLIKQSSKKKQLYDRVLMAVQCNHRDLPKREIYYEMKTLYMVSRDQAIRRLKVVIREDRQICDPLHHYPRRNLRNTERYTNRTVKVKIKVARNVVLMIIDNFVQRLIQFYSIMKRGSENDNSKR